MGSDFETNCYAEFFTCQAFQAYRAASWPPISMGVPGEI